MGTDPSTDLGLARRRVMAATRDLDGATVRDVLLDALLVSGVDATVTDVMMPVLREVGDDWEAGRLGVVHEHFVSSAFRGVLGELRLPVQGPQARTVVLACPPRELHDLPLELFGAMLHARWWRVVSLGANSPMTAIGEAARFLRADAVVLAGVRRTAFEARLPSLTRLGRTLPLFVAGEGAKALAQAPPELRVLPDDLVAAAELVDAVVPAREEAVPVHTDGDAEPAVG
ncbi:cobalamin B12-binding domain-containing protein [Phycicoccus sonneratiae]|uniref:B12-binding domain-containing protein n=1 Tax=Phycicoccus sonneratiae TaxID=2807628 RepID=A0ABS2CHJ8_9MICO|nr:B12-binding domain-containing protein [Phycicoccus sonneraticus]MBM6399344.1 B12-binding domain-containing protein [Phycicoccus sonneraticus]